MARWPGMAICLFGAVGLPFALFAVQLYLMRYANLIGRSNALVLAAYLWALGCGLACWLGMLAFCRSTAARVFVGFLALAYLPVISGPLYAFGHYLIWDVFRIAVG